MTKLRSLDRDDLVQWLTENGVKNCETATDEGLILLAEAIDDHETWDNYGGPIDEDSWKSPMGLTVAGICLCLALLLVRPIWGFLFGV